MLISPDKFLAHQPALQGLAVEPMSGISSGSISAINDGYYVKIAFTGDTPVTDIKLYNNFLIRKRLKDNSFSPLVDELQTYAVINYSVDFYHQCKMVGAFISDVGQPNARPYFVNNDYREKFIQLTKNLFKIRDIASGPSSDSEVAFLYAQLARYQQFCETATKDAKNYTLYRRHSDPPFATNRIDLECNEDTLRKLEARNPGERITLLNQYFSRKYPSLIRIDTPFPFM